MRRRARFVLLLAGSAIAGAAPPPVAAPKPTAPQAPDCRSWSSSSAPRPAGRILPVQDGPSLDSLGDTPEPLPLPPDATPLVAEPNPTLDGLLDRYLPDATPQERGAWADELRLLPTELARDILSARSRSEPPLTLPDPVGESFAPDLPPQEEPAELPPTSPRLAHRDSEPDSSGESTLDVLRRAEAILLHNIANADTVAFKRSRLVFSEAPGSAGLTGVVSQRVDTQGELDETDRSLDLTIEGAGFFQVRRGDDIALTRRGTFGIDDTGRLVIDAESERWSLHPPVEIPPETDSVIVADDGTVSCRLAEAEEPTLVGHIELARVLDPARLDPTGGGLLAVPESPGPVAVAPPGGAGFGILRQGFLERSNVDLDAELKALERLRTQIVAFADRAESQFASPAENLRR